MTDRRELLRALEALLFVSDEPVASVVLAQALEIDRREVDELCEELGRVYEERDAGIVIRTIAGGWRLSTHPDAAPFVEQYVLSSRHARLTKAALETLSIVAYKQPVTRHQISAIRGVNSDGVLRALMDRSLIVEVGREEAPGGRCCTGRPRSSWSAWGCHRCRPCPRSRRCSVTAPRASTPNLPAASSRGSGRCRSNASNGRSLAPGWARAAPARSSSPPGRWR